MSESDVEYLVDLPEDDGGWSYLGPAFPDGEMCQLFFNPETNEVAFYSTEETDV